MTTDTIYTALLKFHSGVKSIKKSSINPYYGSKYANLADVQKAIAQPLQDAGLIIIHQLDSNDTMTSSVIHCQSGKQISATYKLRVERNDSQAWGKAITYAKRYALSSLLNLCIDEDDDGESSRDRRVKLSGKKLDEAKQWILSGEGSIKKLEKKYILTEEQ